MTVLRVVQEPFEVPEGSTPREFDGYVAVGWAGGSWHCGCDVNSAQDAFEHMARRAAEAHKLASGALDDAIGLIHSHTVRVFRVESSDLPSVELLEE